MPEAYTQSFNFPPGPTHLIGGGPSVTGPEFITGTSGMSPVSALVSAGSQAASVNIKFSASETLHTGCILNAGEIYPFDVSLVKVNNSGSARVLGLK